MSDRETYDDVPAGTVLERMAKRPTRDRVDLAKTAGSKERERERRKVRKGQPQVRSES